MYQLITDLSIDHWFIKCSLISIDHWFINWLLIYQLITDLSIDLWFINRSLIYHLITDVSNDHWYINWLLIHQLITDILYDHWFVNCQNTRNTKTKTKAFIIKKHPFYYPLTKLITKLICIEVLTLLALYDYWILSW